MAGIAYGLPMHPSFDSCEDILCRRDIGVQIKTVSIVLLHVVVPWLVFDHRPFFIWNP